LISPVNLPFKSYVACINQMKELITQHKVLCNNRVKHKFCDHKALMTYETGHTGKLSRKSKNLQKNDNKCPEFMFYVHIHSDGRNAAGREAGRGAYRNRV